MAVYSDIILYQTDITPERNCKIDNMNAYLRLCKQYVIENFQYFKAELDTTVKINMAQSNTPNFPYNYFTVANQGEKFVYYYFILGTKWISANTIQLKLSLDTINTFWSKLKWTERTNITRQHKDRYAEASKTVSENYINVRRNVDDFEEGITPVKFLKSQDKMESSQGPNMDHYLVYETINTDEKTPIHCYYYASKNISLDIETSSDGILPSNYPNSKIVIYARDNEDFTYTAKDGKTYEIGKDKTYKGVLINVYNTSTANVEGITSRGGFGPGIQDGNVDFDTGISTAILVGVPIVAYQYPANTYLELFWSYSRFLQFYEDNIDISTRLEFGGVKGFLKSITAVDRTNPLLVKIIKMPYPPFEAEWYNDLTLGEYMKIPNGWIYNNQKQALELTDLSQEFLSTVNQEYLNDELIDTIFIPTIGTEQNSEKHESKLFNSNFYTVKYFYDNFEKELYMERTKPLLQSGGDAPQVNVKFKQSNNISSNSIFDFSVENVAAYKEPKLYGQYMSVNRSQELALYNSEYLNYIRNGYNYDRKAQAQSIGQNIAATVLSAAAGVASFFTANPVGLSAAISFGASAIASITQTIFSGISSERAIQQKLDAAEKSAASVSNTTDLNLLSYYNGNRLISIREQCSDQVRAAIYDLFRLTGYACNEYAVPDFNTRIFYNFVQCKPDFEEKDWTYGQDFLNDIKQKFQIGVTIYHQYNNQYDLLQEKENYESWLPTTS